MGSGTSRRLGSGEGAVGERRGEARGRPREPNVNGARAAPSRGSGAPGAKNPQSAALCRVQRPAWGGEDDEPDDTELLRRLAGPFDADARRALDVLYRRHAPALRGFLTRFRGVDDEQAEDLMHDTFLTALGHAGSFRSGSARPWLLEIAAKGVRGKRRSERRRSRREREAQGPAEDVGASGPAGDDLGEQLNLLPERLRVVLELRYLQGLSVARVATTLGVSLRTAHSWLREGLERLRQRMEESS